MSCECCEEFKMTDIKGVHIPWKDFSAVELAVSFNALKCTKCEEVLIRGSQALDLDAALEESVNYWLNVQEKPCTALRRKPMTEEEKIRLELLELKVGSITWSNSDVYQRGYISPEQMKRQRIKYLEELLERFERIKD